LESKWASGSLEISWSCKVYSLPWSETMWMDLRHDPASISVPELQGCCAPEEDWHSINITLDECCDHPGQRLASSRSREIAQADALLFGRVIYEMMEATWRPPAPAKARPEWTEPFAQTIGAAKNCVVSSALDRVDWNTELVNGDLGKAVRQLKQEPRQGLLVGGVKLPLAFAELGLIDEYESIVQPRLGRSGSRRHSPGCLLLEDVPPEGGRKDGRGRGCRGVGERHASRPFLPRPPHDIAAVRLQPLGWGFLPS